MSLSESFDPKLVEEKLYTFWLKSEAFKADPTSQKSPYTIVIPPPNVTGKLHMGHALVDTIQDILIRFKRMDGYEALWVPGTDHAGIATQGVVEKKLYQETGKRRKDFERDEFIQHIWDWKEKSEGEILNQLKKLGCSLDWSRLRFTMDEGCNKAVRSTFKKMFDEGLIYQGDYLVNWDPVTQTALSDDELEHEERNSFLWYIRYPVFEENASLTIATTRPETMLGDTAVAVHPEDERYKHLIGKEIALPLSNRKIPIIGDTYVDPEFGTGAVKITPAHDFNDFEIGNRHQLDMINIMTPDGKVNSNGGRFEGLSLDQARVEVVQEIERLGLMEKIVPHTLRVGLSYRSKAVMQPYLSKQWFVKMSAFKEKLLSAVREKRVEVIPSHFEATYFHWIENLRDWCISRQLWWGHQIPVWTHKEDSSKMICFDGEGVPEEVKNDPENWVQDPDVLDTWFSSAIWPLSVLGWPEKTQDLKKFYPTSTLVTAHDILFFWVARMIMMGEYLTGEVPFYKTFMHGLIYGKSYWREDSEKGISYIMGEEKKSFDEGKSLPKDVFSKWEKMSKTKGNVIDPIEMIDAYGADAVRMTLASITTHARQIDLDQRKFEEYKNFSNKIFNGAKFVLMNLDSLNPKSFSNGLNLTLLELEDKWILNRLNKAVSSIRKNFEEFHFDRAAKEAYEFFWNDFCSNFVELTKPVLFGKSGNEDLKNNKQKLLLIVLTKALQALHPITPFITEEIFQKIKDKFGSIITKAKDGYTEEVTIALSSPCCALSPFPQPKPTEDEIEIQFDEIQKLVRTIRNIRAEMKIPLNEKTDLYIQNGSKLVKENQNIIYSLTQTNKVHFEKQPPNLFGAESTLENMNLFIPMPETLKEKNRERLAKEKEKIEKQILSLEAKLENQSFREKAPAKIVEGLQDNLKSSKETLDKIIKQLQS